MRGLQALGRVEGLGFGGLGFRLQASGFRLQGLGFGFRVEGVRVWAA